MREYCFSVAAILLLVSASAAAAPPSKNPENSAAALSPEDKEAWDNANRAKDALGAGLLERARLLATKAESIKRTRETAYLRAAVELRSAIDDVVRAAEVIESYENLVKLGKPDPRALKIAGDSLNLATVQIDDAKEWGKEIQRLDSSYKNLSFLTEEIKKCETNIATLDKQLVALRAPEDKREREGLAGKKDDPDPKGRVKDTIRGKGKSASRGNDSKGATLAALLTAGEWDTEYVTGDGRSARGKWHYEFVEDGTFMATRTSLTADKFDRAKLVASEYKGKWKVESRKLTRDESRAIGKAKVNGSVPVLTVTLADNEVQHPFIDSGLSANGTFKGIINTNMSKTSRVVFMSLYSDNLVLPDPSDRPLILIHP